MVERLLAKEKVASSSLVFRSIFYQSKSLYMFFLPDFGFPRYSYPAKLTVFIDMKFMPAMLYIPAILAHKTLTFTPAQGMLVTASRVSGDVAKWQGRGLQNPHQRFESARRLFLFSSQVMSALMLVFIKNLHIAKSTVKNSDSATC